MHRITRRRRGGLWGGVGGALALALLAGAFAATAPKPKQGGKSAPAKPKVYVCACLGNKSCACMSEAKTEGPCSCGTEGGPPMKAVACDSDWAKANRRALAGH